MNKQLLIIIGLSQLSAICFVAVGFLLLFNGKIRKRNKELLHKFVANEKINNRIIRHLQSSLEERMPEVPQKTTDNNIIEIVGGELNTMLNRLIEQTEQRLLEFGVERVEFSPELGAEAIAAIMRLHFLESEKQVLAFTNDPQLIWDTLQPNMDKISMGLRHMFYEGDHSNSEQTQHLQQKLRSSAARLQKEQQQLERIQSSWDEQLRQMDKHYQHLVQLTQVADRDNSDDDTPETESDRTDATTERTALQQRIDDLFNASILLGVIITQTDIALKDMSQGPADEHTAIKPPQDQDDLPEPSDSLEPSNIDETPTDIDQTPTEVDQQPTEIDGTALADVVLEDLLDSSDDPALDEHTDDALNAMSDSTHEALEAHDDVVSDSSDVNNVSNIDREGMQSIDDELEALLEGKIEKGSVEEGPAEDPQQVSELSADELIDDLADQLTHTGVTDPVKTETEANQFIETNYAEVTTREGERNTDPHNPDDTAHLAASQAIEEENTFDDLLSDDLNLYDSDDDQHEPDHQASA